MKGRALRTALFLGGIALAAALPGIGRAVRARGAERCALDGVLAAGPSLVRVIAGDGSGRAFCCVECARTWLARAGADVERVQVTDEATGGEVAADEAWFVESRVPVAGRAGSFVHAFSTEAAARRHAEEYGGRVLAGPWRPFAFDGR